MIWLFVIFFIAFAVYTYSGKQDTLPLPAPTPAPTPVVAPSEEQKKTLFDTSGTTYEDTMLELYPNENYTGWGSTGVDPRGIHQTTATWRTGDTSGKSVIFMSQVNGQKIWHYKSFKVTPGTILMLYSESGGTTSRGFLMGDYNVNNIRNILEVYPELTRGNTGIFMDGWEHWDMDFFISVLDESEFEYQKKLKYRECYDRITGGKTSDNDLLIKAHSFCHWDGVSG